MAIEFVHLTTLFLVVLSSLLLSQGAAISETEDLQVCETQVCKDSARFLLESMNSSVDPCNDFYQYACGGWISKHPIPKGEDIHTMTSDLNNKVYAVIAGLFRNATNENHPKAVMDAARLFQGCMDEGARERVGTEPLRNLLNSVGGWPMIDPEWSNSTYKWYEQVAKLRRILDVRPIISVEVTDDFEASRNRGRIFYFSEPSFGTDKEYVMDQDSAHAKVVIREYKKFIIATAQLLNPELDKISLRKDAEEIIQFEAALARDEENVTSQEVSKEDEEEKEEAEEEEAEEEEEEIPWYEELMKFLNFMSPGVPEHSFKHTISDFQALTENEDFRWIDFLNDILQDLPQLPDETEIAVLNPDYYKRVIELVQNTDQRIVANYIGWILVKTFGSYTTKDFRDNEIRFERKSHLEEEEDLETACVEQTNSVMDFAVGRLYVDKYVSEEEIREIEQLVEDVRSAFEVNFNHNDWMDHKTKQKALEKLRHMAYFVGYPAWIKSDSELNDYYREVGDVRPEEYFESFVRIKTVMEAKGLGQWNQPIHRTTEWDQAMSILEVNAMYAPSRNTMYFPAAVFNIPIFRRGTLPALNYAGLGAFIAHEITHGFDSEGHKYDKEGNAADWWSLQSKRRFEKKAECIRGQYGKIVEPTTNMSLNEDNTLPDDIADHGAVRNAFMAFEMQMIEAEEDVGSRRNMRLPGLSRTPEQLYFQGVATMECVHYTETSLKWTIENDDHSPAEFRVRLPLRNSRAFAEAYNCPVGSPMNPEKKCQLW